MILASESPYAACRPCATVIGPVGLTLTYSSRTGSPKGSLLPYPSPAESSSSSSSPRAAGESRKLIKPGPATSTLSTKGASKEPAMFCATSRGLRLNTLAFARATLVAKSPWAASFGRSTWTPFSSIPYAFRTASRRAPATRSSRPDLLAIFSLWEAVEQPLGLRRHPFGLFAVAREARLESVPRPRVLGQQLSRHVEALPSLRVEQQYHHPIVLERVQLHPHNRMLPLLENYAHMAHSGVPSFPHLLTNGTSLPGLSSPRGRAAPEGPLAPERAAGWRDRRIRGRRPS